MRFPDATIRYLHLLVAGAHNMLYRGDTFRIAAWGKILFVDVPHRLVREPAVWISFVLFWGLFLGSAAGAMAAPEFARRTVGESMLSMIESMYSKPLDVDFLDESRTAMAGFYVFNNAGIGLRSFAGGILLGVGSLVVMGYNAMLLGTIFGHMAGTPQADNFFTFVTAHGPFELTAVVLSGAAGLRLGWSVIDTRGYSRLDALRRAAAPALELAGVATLLFVLAAFIEGYISPLPIDYGYKAAVAIVSTLLLAAYAIVLGLTAPKGRADAA